MPIGRKPTRLQSALFSENSLIISNGLLRFAFPALPEMRCQLILSDGSTFVGKHIGAPFHASGEVVFSTAMVGYHESLSDPSYYGQVLLFSYPLIGNYGVPRFETSGGLPPPGFESSGIHVAAVIVNWESPWARHWNSAKTLHEWLCEHGVPGIAGVDTREIVRRVRSGNGVTAKLILESQERTLMRSLRNPASELVISEVSRKDVLRVGSGKTRIVVIDCGVKWNIVRGLAALGCEVDVVPWDSDFLRMECSGFLLSNGPGDPMLTADLVPRIRDLLALGKPVLGICLGHQLLALAAGARTRRMEFGHRGHNQPVYEVGSRRGFLTSQNHGYVVCEDSLPQEWEAWFRNANDDSLEGMRHKQKPFWATQFHPEASAGPQDTAWILVDFVSQCAAEG